MALINKIEESARTLERFNEDILLGVENTAKIMNIYNGRIADFFADAYKSPFKTFKQLYKDVLTNLRH